VHFYVLTSKEKSRAILPIHIENNIFGKTASSLSNYYTSNFSLIMEENLRSNELVSLLDAIKSNNAPMNSIRLAPMDSSSDSYQTLMAAFRESGYIPFRFFCFGNWYQPITSDWKDYLEKRPGIVRNTIKRAKSKFFKKNGTLEIIRHKNDVERAIHAYNKVYSHSWKKSEPYPGYISNLINLCAENDWLRLGIAHLDNEPIAVQIWIVANGKANIYKLAYDEKYKSYAPGTLLTAFLAESVIDQDKVFEIDYLTGDDPYKKDWMDYRRERWGIIAYNPKTLYGFFGIARECLSRMIKQFKI